MSRLPPFSINYRDLDLVNQIIASAESIDRRMAGLIKGMNTYAVDYEDLFCDGKDFFDGKKYSGEILKDIFSFLHLPRAYRTTYIDTVPTNPYKIRDIVRDIDRVLEDGRFPHVSYYIKKEIQAAEGASALKWPNPGSLDSSGNSFTDLGACFVCGSQLLLPIFACKSPKNTRAMIFQCTNCYSFVPEWGLGYDYENIIQKQLCLNSVFDRKKDARILDLNRDFEYLVDWIEKMSGFQKKAVDDRVLEIGCGCGMLLSAFKRHRYRVRGFDINEIQVQRGRRLFDLSDEEICVASLADSILVLDRECIKYDMVVLWHTLQAIYEPLKSLDDLSRLVADDGVVVIQMSIFSERNINYGCYFYPTEVSMKCLLRGTRFRVLSVEYDITNYFVTIFLKAQPS